MKVVICVSNLERVLLVSVFRRVRKIAKNRLSFVTSVSVSSRNDSAPTGRIFMKFGI